MNWEYIKERWPLFVEAAKKWWPRLGAPELAATGGDRKALVGKLREHYGYLTRFAEEEVDRFYAGCLQAAAIGRDSKGTESRAVPRRFLEPPDPADEYISS